MTTTPILVPKEMVNDDAYVVLALLAKPGEMVDKGQALAELETSKASFVVESPARGYFQTAFAPGDSVGVGAAFGTISDTPEATAERKVDNGPDPRFSRAAWELFAKSGLPAERFAGFELVGKADVELALRQGDAPDIPDPDALTAAEKKRAIVLLGGGGHALECLDILEQNSDYDVFGFTDTRAAPGSDIGGYPVLGGNDALPRLLAAGIENLVLAYGIAGHHPDRGAHFRRLAEAGHAFPAVVHPKAAVNRRAVVGRGVQIMGCALVGARAAVGDAGIINSGAVVSHDCVLGDNVHVAPGAVLAGGVRVGADSVVGMGATVYMRVRIGRAAVVHNGANVFADVPDGAVVRGEWRG